MVKEVFTRKDGSWASKEGAVQILELLASLQPGSRNSTCKGPEAGACLAALRNSKGLVWCVVRQEELGESVGHSVLSREVAESHSACWADRLQGVWTEAGVGELQAFRQKGVVVHAGWWLW